MERRNQQTQPIPPLPALPRLSQPSLPNFARKRGKPFFFFFSHSLLFVKLTNCLLSGKFDSPTQLSFSRETLQYNPKLLALTGVYCYLSFHFLFSLFCSLFFIFWGFLSNSDIELSRSEIIVQEKPCGKILFCCECIRFFRP